MSNNIESLRNFALVGNNQAGKSSIAEAILFNSEALKRLGKVDDGSACMDFSRDELKRKMSINSSLGKCKWKKHDYYFVDTPGFIDFMFDVKASLSVADSAIYVCDALSGRGGQTEEIFEYLENYNVPCTLFINKMDKENANWKKSVTEITELLDRNDIVPVMLPIMENGQLNGYVDLVKNKAFKFTNDPKKLEDIEIPADLNDEVEEYREKLMEIAAETDESLMDVYCEEGTLAQDAFIKGLKTAFSRCELIPTIMGTATVNKGIVKLMDFLQDVHPSPVEKVNAKATKINSEEEIEIKLDDPNLCGRIFKMVTLPHLGELAYVRIYSGEIKKNDMVYNSVKEEKEKIGQLLYMNGKNRIDTETAYKGEFVAILKLKNVSFGNTLCAETNAVVLPEIALPRPVVQSSIKATSQEAQDKLGLALQRIAAEDPSFSYYIDTDFAQTIIEGMGSVHLDIVLEKIDYKYGVSAVLGKPKIPYRETMKSKSVKVQGKYKKQSGGRGQYGDVWIEFSGQPRGEGFEFVNNIVGGVIPGKFIPAVEKGLNEAMVKGALANYPTIDIKARLYDGSYHNVDSSELAFKIAASMAFKKAMAEGGGGKAIILEPIVKVQITVPEEYMGDIMGDLNSRRGKIIGMESKGKRSKIINALVPQADMYMYVSTLRSMTQGRGHFIMDFDHYEEVPSSLSGKVIEEAKKAKEEDKD